MTATIEGLRSRLAEIRSSAGGAKVSVALVSTLGALHEGHVDLIREARSRADAVIVSSFVNPLRFRSAAEVQAYPVRSAQDDTLLASLDVDEVFTPSAAELLPSGIATMRVAAGDLGLRYEGRTRPFYFDGLLTAEAIMFHLVKPDVAVYGERDLQRIFLVRRMVRDLFFDVDIATISTARSDGGLPISSRVPLLEPADRRAAALLPRALEAAASNADRGVDACIAAAQSSLMGEPRIRLEYLSVVDPATFLPVDSAHSGRAFALIAATVAGHRFIDNAEISLP